MAVTSLYFSRYAPGTACPNSLNAGGANHSEAGGALPAPRGTILLIGKLFQVIALAIVPRAGGVTAPR